MNKNLVILFYPKTGEDQANVNIPISLFKIGSELKEAGYEVDIIDERFEANYEKRLGGILDKAIFFGVSSMTGRQIQGGLKASRVVKKRAGDVPVVWGGWHPSILPEETLMNENIDIIVRGQGEAAVCALAGSLKNGKDLEGIDGLLYKKNGAMLSNKPPQLQDLNSFRPLRFDTIEIARYTFKNYLGKRAIFWNSSQGCPYLCGFCSTPAVYCRRWTGLKAETLLEQLGTLVDRYGIDGVTFAEDNFFVDANRVEKLCRGIVEKDLGIRWSTDARIDQINRFSDNFLDLLKESGCSKLYIGAESGDEEVLELVDKRIKLSDIYKTAERLNRHKIISEFFLIVGFPKDPKRDFIRSLDLMKRIKRDYPDHQFTVFLYTPYPGTPLLDLAVRRGLKIPGRLEDWSGWGILSVNTPWVDEKYLDKINMYSKCFYPLAFPSSSLREKFKKRFGFLYKILHIISRFRVKNNFFLFPVEWKLIKLFYKIKMSFNIFKSIESFR